jgi:hypothetical protein
VPLRVDLSCTRQDQLLSQGKEIGTVALGVFNGQSGMRLRGTTAPLYARQSLLTQSERVQSMECAVTGTQLLDIRRRSIQLIDPQRTHVEAEVKQRACSLVEVNSAF